jgi:small subunit ribosomal protein S20
MPIIQSAKKRVKTATKATIRNRKTKRSVKSVIKAFESSLSTSKSKSPELLINAQSAIDTAVKKGVIHKNKASRKKAQLVKSAKEAGIKTNILKKPTAKKTTVITAKKATAKKTTTKK